MVQSAPLRHRLILCEANDDVSLVKWVASRAGVSDLDIRITRTWPPDIDLVESYIKDPVFNVMRPAIAAIVDADSNPTKRRSQAIRLLKKLSPDSPLSVYLLPNNQDPGEVENLYLNACRNHALLTCAEAYADCAAALMTPGTKRVKLAYQAYAAPIRFNRRAIEHTDFDTEFDYNHADIQKLVEFLRTLV